MSFTRFSLSRITIFIALLAIPMAAFAADIARPSAGGSVVTWQLNVAGIERVELRIANPEGDVSVYHFKGGKNPAVSLQELGGLDGAYSWEMIVIPKISETVTKKLEAARKANDEAAAKSILKAAGLDVSAAQSGTISASGGLWISTDAVESTSRDFATAGGRNVATDARPILKPATNTLFTDNVYIQDSLCVGIDCVNNSAFGFDTIRLEENNTRIKFQDTSVGSFPSSDWQLTANDSTSGGQNKFSIEDISGSRIPFTVEANSPNNSIYIDSTGRVGFRTTTPVLDIHINTNNSPGIRLEQNSSGGFSAQSWDIAGNEANFFVRDVTNGSRLPFRIRPGAPTSSIDISASGKVGIGTGSPAEKVHVFENANQNTIAQVENTNTGTAAAGVLRTAADVAAVSFQSHGSGRTISRFGQVLGSWNEMLAVTGNGLIIGTNNSTPLILGTNQIARLTISNTGAVTIPGDLTVSGTKNFGVPDPGDDSKAIYFSALEGPEAGTYFRGTAKTVNGEVTIKLPGHFTRMTEKEKMTVQLTPVGAPGQLYIASRTPEQIVIRVADGSKDLEFDYLVQGVRLGYLDFQVERENNLN